MAADRRRTIPGVDTLLRSGPGRRAVTTFGRPLLKRSIADTLEDVRRRAAEGEEVPFADEILAAAVARAARVAGGLTPVINATGVLLHTGLGRAPLARTAVRAVTAAAQDYADLEVDRDSGARGSRGGRVEALLRAITGAEAALVVNNCAAALVLSLAALAKGKPVLVSRGELIEIGGEFRIPDIMAASGARLVEVGTTNRTRKADYGKALDDRTAAILKVHPSNYRVVGFTAEAPAADLAALARAKSIPFIYDVGSGLLDAERGFPGEEPTVRGALEAGADLVTCSGDKLLGGPQAGIILGRADLIERLRRHPLARAMRVDKLQVAALGATLALYAKGEHGSVPVHRMIHESADLLSKRAHRLSETIGGDLEGAHVVRTESVVGGGSLPGLALAGWGVRVKVPDPNAFAHRLRVGRPSVFCRVTEDHVVLDVRTMTDDEVPRAARAVLYALEGDDFDDD
jgi:L-seryl-tRNA(Ser) seleniumtransferase